MPEYQSLTDPSQIHNEHTNPYITKRFKKDKTLIKRRLGRENNREELGNPLLRDLLIMRDGIETIMGYDQLAGPDDSEIQAEDLDSTRTSKTPDLFYEDPPIPEPQPKETRGIDVDDIDVPPGPVWKTKPTSGVEVPRDAPYSDPRGYDRDDPINPEELELLRLILLLITKGK